MYGKCKEELCVLTIKTLPNSEKGKQNISGVFELSTVLPKLCYVFAGCVLSSGVFLSNKTFTKVQSTKCLQKLHRQIYIYTYIYYTVYISVTKYNCICSYSICFSEIASYLVTLGMLCLSKIIEA